MFSWILLQKEKSAVTKSYQTLILLKNHSCCETFNAFVAYVYDLFSYLSSLKDQKQRNNCLGNLNWLADGLKVSKKIA